MPSKKVKCKTKGCDNLTRKNRCRECWEKDMGIVRGRDVESRKQYRRNWRLKKKYGIDEEGFGVLWVAFRGKCGICKIDLKSSVGRRGQPLDVAVVDHDHATGNLRGLLCNGCNKGLGLFKDNPETLRAAANWVEGK